MTAVLVANRGEVAVRVFRTARRLGLRCVAVYSDADAEAPFVRLADEAVRIGPPPPAESYLRADRLVEAALATGAELVHPGYGFLAEDAEFAEACAKAGLRFVGPPAGVLRAMGAKDEARRIARAAGVPVLPGYEGEDQSEEALARAAAELGYPVVVKPAEGGGGKGMAVVRAPGELPAALASARRVAAAAFGDDRLLLERYLEGARHVEVQVVADTHGNVVHLGERDCTLQRRYQKVVEEAPSPFADQALRAKLCDAAVALARRAGYVNAGTCEFLVGPGGEVGFIEMNARLQVEHPVTELVYGVDLVELQLRVALGEPLPVRQEDLRPSGWAVEARVYAEDPEQGFLPQAGRVLHLRWPRGVRVDTGLEEGVAVPPHYDPLLAKVVAWGPDRAEALAALRRALEGAEVLGVRTNLPFLRALASDPVVAGGAATTSWLEQAYAGWSARPPRPPEEVAALAAAEEAERVLGTGGPDPWASLGPWRVGGEAPVVVVVRAAGEERTVAVAGRGPFRVGASEVRRAGDCHGWELDGRRGAAAKGEGVCHVWWEGLAYELELGPAPRRVEEAGPAHLGAPMPGQVIAVRVEAGDRVVRGQELVVVEAMKMEHAVVAPADGVVRAVLCGPGDQVERGQTLVDFEAVRED